MAKLKKLGLIIASCLMMLAVCLGLTACGDKVGKVKESSIVYDGTKITWAEAKNAESYIVTINERPFVTTATSYPYRAKSSEMEITVSICGVGAKDKEGKEVSRTFMRLDTMERTEITFDEEGVMSWSDVDGADSYLLSINGEVETVVGTSYEDFPVGKSLTIKVKPNRTDGLGFSDWSSNFSKTYLAAPALENIKYDGVELSWRGVMSAQSYEVYINGNLFEQNGTKMEYDAEQESFEVEIKAKNSSPDIYDSVMTDVKEFIFLPVIEGMEVADGQLRWPEVAQATSYDVKIGSAAAINTTDTFINLETGKDLSIKVKPVTSGEVYFSDWSNPKSVHILAAPVLTWDSYMTMEDGLEGRPISWSPITAAEGYEVQIEEPDGGIDTKVADGLSFEYAFNATGGKYTVRVKATTSSEDVYSSAYSAPIVVERLAAPSLRAQKPIISNPKNNKSFDVTWNSVFGATDYWIYLNNNRVRDVMVASYTATIRNPISAEETSAVELQYMIQSRGAGVKALSGGGQSVTLSSIIPKEGVTAEVCSFEITSMAVPTGLDCKGQYMTWEGNAEQYAVNGTLSDEPVTAHSAQYDLYKLSAGLKQLSVCAQGNGTTTLASNYSPSINVEKLGKPDGIHVIGQSTSEPEVAWTAVPHASSYTMRLNESEASINVKSASSIISKEYVKTEGLTLSLTAIRDAWESGVYYVTSDESAPAKFYKIATPTFNKQIVVNNDELVWNKPTNVQDTGEVFTYTLWANGSIYKQSLTTNTIKLSELGFTPGEQYDIKVQCIGDSTCFTSEQSELRSLVVLDTPELQRNANDTKYTWTPLNGMFFPEKYEILVNGKTVKTVDFVASPEEDYYSYEPKGVFTDVNATYRVQIRALGNDGIADGDVALVNSAFKDINQRVYRLETPSLNLSYEVDGQAATHYDVNGLMKLSVVTPIQYATGYGYVFGGATAITSVKDEDPATSWSVKPDATGAFAAKICAKGDVFDDAGNYYIDSYYTEDSNVILHSKVETRDINKLVAGGFISWKTTTVPTSGYTVKIYYNNEAEASETQQASVTRIQVNGNINDVTKVEIIKNPTMNETQFEIGSESAFQNF